MSRILFVCTANRCRSPVAEACFREVLDARGLRADVESAGLLPGGGSVPGDLVRAMRARGVDLSHHSSRELTPAMVEQADLVLGMARDHVREIAVRVPGVWPRTFTLKEAIRRGAGTGPRQLGDDLTGWVARLHEGRRSQDLLGSSTDDDVDDPIGKSRREYEATVVEIEDLTRRLAALLWSRDPALSQRGS